MVRGVRAAPRTTENLLAVWEVAEDRSNLERVVRAVAVGRQKIDHMGFIVFSPELLISFGIEIRPSRGGSFDQVANDWHRDLVLSGKKLVALVDAMLRHGESGTLLKKSRRGCSFIRRLHEIFSYDVRHHLTGVRVQSNRIAV